MKLWEVQHAYYCSESNYYAPGMQQPSDSFKSWAEFVAEYDDADFSYNLLFRWDWREGIDWELPEFNGDQNYRNGQLMICWMGQHKGLYRWSLVEVCRADEPAIRKWLQPRLDHLMSLWAPMTPNSVGEVQK